MKPFLFLIFLLSFFKISYSQKWENVTPAGYPYVYKAYFLNAREGWVLAQSQTNFNLYFLLHTSDSAKSFELIYTFPEDYGITTLQFIDSLNGFAMVFYPGNFNLFWRTRDGGHTWQDLTNNEWEWVPGLFFLDKNTGFLSGDKSIFKTIDGGLSWQKTNTPVYGQDSLLLFDVHYSVNRLFFIDHKYGWAACGYPWDGGFGMKTTDGGLSWQICTSFWVPTLFGVHFIDSLKGGMVGRNAYFTVVLLTEDNFNSFSHDYEDWPQFPETIYYQNDSTIWVSGDPALIRKSTDAGANFVNYDTISVPELGLTNINNIQIFNHTGYAIGTWILLKYQEPGSHIPRIDDTKNDFKLWPNPAIDFVSININIPKSKKINIILYTVEGIPVLKTNKRCVEGTNRIDIRIGYLPRGVYYITLYDGIYQSTKKIVKY